MPDIHLRFGGSTIARTIGCTAWPKLSDKMPKGIDDGSSFAHEGTMLHNCMEERLRDHALFADMLKEGREYKGAVLTEDLLSNKLIPALDAVLGLFVSLDIHEVEGFILEPFVQLIEGQAGGSIDLLAVSRDRKTVLVLDYKFGFNLVDIEDNAQLRFYGLCASVDPDTAGLFTRAEKIVFAIVQPNDQGRDTLQVEECDMDVLDGFEDLAYDAIDEACEEGAELTPTAGAWCQYCPAHATCPAKTGLAAEALRLPPAELEKLSAAMAIVDEVEKWAKAVKKTAHEQMEAGVVIEGFKLVNKRATRVWTGTEEVEKKIRNNKKITAAEAHETKLISPPKMEKLCKAKKVDFKKFEDYISAVSSGTTIAHSDDKRPEALPSLALKALADRL